jgi:lipoprotein-releasing system permease protein
VAGFERYIAKRMLKNSADKSRFSRPITRIAVASVALGVCVMILSVSIVRGFQYEIRDKVIGFGSHIQINHRTTNNSFESVPVQIDSALMNEIGAQDGVKHVQPYAIKPAILQVRRKTEDTTRKNENEILGVICKGVNKDFDWTFFQKNLKSGSVLDLNKRSERNEIVLSKGIADKLKVDVNDSLYLFMVVADGPKPNKFFVKGIYETGLSDFDDQFVFIDIYHIQKINDWGVEGFVSIGERRQHDFTLHSIVTGGAEHRLYQWNGAIPSYMDSSILPLKDTSLTLIVSDNKRDADDRDWILKFQPDTVKISIQYKKINTKTDSILDYPIVSTVNDSTTLYRYKEDLIYLTQKNTGGSYRYTAGGYEVLLNGWDDLLRSDQILSDVIPYDFETKPITQIYAEIFDWLELLDTNVNIIILLMLLICLINMSSTLLVIILERTAMIGTMKALGSSNRSISKIFVYNASWYIIRGLIIGNILAIGLGILQQQTGFIKMNQETYFMSTVPVHLEIWYILAIDLGTLVICTIAMLLPSMIISKISPVKAIRFK